jgi:GcrA cell cycle regulator
MKHNGPANTDVYWSDVSLMGKSPTERFKWTDERVAQFRDLYAQGLSHGQIGAFFGITRNACIGKAHRLGLAQRAPARQPKPWIDAGVSESTWHRRLAKASHRASQGQDGASGEPRYRRDTSSIGHSFQVATIGTYATDLTPEIIAHPVTLMELEPHHCRWPHDRDGEPMMYCGANRFIDIDGRRHAYCAGHCRMAHVAPRLRKVVYHHTAIAFDHRGHKRRVPGNGRRRVA